MKVTWDANKCCHAGVCVQTLPEVFKVEDGHFIIDTEAAGEETIADVVSACPSGALAIQDE
jgi:uncharacterized Fe-S cluster protein YjdI